MICGLTAKKRTSAAGPQLIKNATLNFKSGECLSKDFLSNIYMCCDQHKMDEHVANVQDFQSMMSAHSDWLNDAEQILSSFKHPSKLVERVLQQINEHKVP